MTRLAVGAMLACATGFVYQNLGANAQPKAIYDIFGKWWLKLVVRVVEKMCSCERRSKV